MKVDDKTNWQDIVNSTVEGMSFGAVQIIVHNSKVVQIERTEKIRFDGATNNPAYNSAKER